MRLDKPSATLAYAGWASVFVEAWLLLLRIIPSDVFSWTFFGIFLLIAVWASAIYTGNPKKDGIISPDDLVVKVDNTIHTQSNKGLSVGPERPDGKMIVIVQKAKKPA